ncbi:MAG: hypothetical protein HY264_00695 [Chloroflexi bacterium]|nr:hypothetical protein [Chloroflexota bacterium]
MGFFRVVGGLILAFLAIGLAGAIFQTGYLAGAAGTGTAVVGPAYGWGWGFGGGLFHFLGFIFFVFLFFALLRAVFGSHRHGWGPGWRGYGRGRGPGEHGDHPGSERFGPWEDRARQAHDEWHRRQDAAPASPAARPSGPIDGSTPNGGSDAPPAGGTAA